MLTGFLYRISTIFLFPLEGPDAPLVFFVCLLLMALIVVFMFIRIPRLLALFTSSDWRDGFILRHVPTTHRAQFPSLDSKAKEFGTPETNVYYPFASGYGSHRTRYPLHIPANIRFMRPILEPFRARISPGFSSGQLGVLAIYLTLLCFATFYKSNFLIDHSRTGWLAVSQLPFLFAFAQKNSLLGAFLGFGYEKLNFVHRFAGKVVVVVSNVHSIGFFYKWSLEGTLRQNMKTHAAISGTISLVCFNIMYLFSTPYIRHKAYNLFYRSHIIAVFAVLPALYTHKTAPYVLTCASLYALDYILRLIKTRFATAYIQPLTELDVTRVQIPHLNAGWHAGQHVRLRVLSFQMGWLGWAETHPFTIANISRGSPEGLTLLCKRTGDWTRKLYDAAKAGKKYGTSGMRIKVLVEGPYGGPGHTIYSSFSAAVLIAGGSGISYALSVIQDLVQKDLNNESRIRIIDLVWSVRDPASVVPLLPTFSSLVRDSVRIQIRIHVFYTAALTKQSGSVIKSSLSTLVDISRSRSNKGGPTGIITADDLPRGISFSAGRPTLSIFFNEAIRHMCTLHLGGGERVHLTGMVVGVCGPVSMVDGVSKAVNAIDSVKRDRIGGVEICAEMFEW